jgi:hypothetical protein
MQTKYLFQFFLQTTVYKHVSFHYCSLKKLLHILYKILYHSHLHQQYYKMPPKKRASLGRSTSATRRMAACRAAETSEQKEARREEARTRHATARAAETPLSICYREFTVYSASVFVESFVINVLSCEEFQFETDYREHCEMKL